MATYELTISKAVSTIIAYPVFLTKFKFATLLATVWPSVDLADKTINIDLWGQTDYFWLTGIPSTSLHPPMLSSTQGSPGAVDIAHISINGEVPENILDFWQTGPHLLLHL